MQTVLLRDGATLIRSNNTGPSRQLPFRSNPLNFSYRFRGKNTSTVICTAEPAVKDREDSITATLPKGGRIADAVSNVTLASSPSSDGADQRSDDETFVWRAHWYPLGIIKKNFREDTPNHVRLLGEDIVVWNDGDGQWCAAVDECPHRLARLSDGRIDNGKLECRYHGWVFDADGKCVQNPQADGPAAEATTLASSRSCLKRYPTRVDDGLLWVWPQPNAWVESLKEQPCMAEEEPGWFGMPDFGFNVNPATFAAMVENALDPDHAPFLHVGVLGKKENAAPMHMKLATEISTNGGFTVEHDGYLKKQKEKGMTATRTFIPPGTVRTDYTFEDGSGQRALLHFVPVDPDSTRVYAKFSFKGAGSGFGAPRAGGLQKLIRQIIGRIAGSGLAHISGHGLIDQDNLILASSGHNMAKAKRGWRDFYLATSADVGVTAFHRWLSERAGGHPDFVGGFPKELPPVYWEQAWDRYERHTKHCSTCQESLRSLDKWSNGLLAASIGLGALAVLLSPSMQLGVRAAPVAAALGCLALWRALQNARKQFFTTDRLPGEKPAGL
eukprot:jgi/Botrbrau1/9253/Bobra.180_1s0011.1